MKCPNCDAPMLKSGKFCPDCGAKNPLFQTADERLERHDKDIEELKKKGSKKVESDDDDSLLS